MMAAVFPKLMDDVVCSEMNVGAASSARVANDGMID